MRLIYFLSPPFLLSHEMIPALVHLASLKMESLGTLKKHRDAHRGDHFISIKILTFRSLFEFGDKDGVSVSW